ncbi:O-methyltransferase-domain-containing protein [Suillus clintonianus]|uniref:O-methyltransferase-domain-containing protein n=1 Tax=Suillus clintonianus TaxID=1904413 RepID=UPI001B86A9FF|nr:O-methyltransferase-domain-containing protein [Suillus clintonianus]KAG2141936.1 O-methyltransferase-domain-containing protein [Suillus clintonianus]
MVHAELDRLQACLNFALDTLRKEMDKSQLPPLSQHSLVEHPLDDPTTYLPSTALFEARRLSLACLGELKDLVQTPLDKRMDERYTAYAAVCTDTLIKTGIIDYLSDVPNSSQGVPAAELASRFELDSQKLVPILRCFAANGWARETCDYSFALNRCSRSFIKGHAGRRLNLFMPGFMSMVESIPSWVMESDWKLSRSPAQTPFQIAFKTPLHRFAWVMEHPHALIPIADHLQVHGDMSTPSVVADYPWKQLDTPIIVDCGGGKGGLVSAILDAHPSFQAIVQDTENVVALTSSIMEERRPRDVENGRLKVEAHDFFQPQPRIGNDYSFILRHIIHDWPDDEAVGVATILGNVARALGPKSKILIVDMVVVPNVDSTATTNAELFLLDSDVKRVDYSVPSHFGSASKIVNAFSVHMLTLMNGCERSLPEWETLVKGCGLCITNVYPLRAHTSIIECALDTRASP